MTIKRTLPKGMISLDSNSEYAKSVRAKLKGSGSQRRVNAQQLRRLKESENPTRIQQIALNLIEDSKISKIVIGEVYAILLQKKGKLSDEMLLKLGDSLARFHKIVFPTPFVAIQQNVNYPGGSLSMAVVNKLFSDKEETEKDDDIPDKNWVLKLAEEISEKKEIKKEDKPIETSVEK